MPLKQELAAIDKQIADLRKKLRLTGPQWVKDKSLAAGGMETADYRREEPIRRKIRKLQKSIKAVKNKYEEMERAETEAQARTKAVKAGGEATPAKRPAKPKGGAKAKRPVSTGMTPAQKLTSDKAEQEAKERGDFRRRWKKNTPGSLLRSHLVK